MKKLACLLFCFGLFITACQKSIDDIGAISGNEQDSLLNVGDTITYEVLTSDTVGWFGVWNLPDGTQGSNELDSVTYGSPVYLPSGWQYTFVAPARPFQAFISVATHMYTDDITVNLYKNGQLLKSITNDAMKGVAKLLIDVNADSLTGTPSSPVLTYEVLVSDRDTTKYQSESWLGQWTIANGTPNDLNNPLKFAQFAIPSGWRYTFKPARLPFTMRMATAPYTPGGAMITTRFYVNGQLVKSAAGRDWMYDIEYTVQ